MTTDVGTVDVRVPATDAYAVDARTDGPGATQTEVPTDLRASRRITVHTGIGVITVQPTS